MSVTMKRVEFFDVRTLPQPKKSASLQPEQEVEPEQVYTGSSQDNIEYENMWENIPKTNEMGGKISGGNCKGQNYNMLGWGN